MLRAFLCSAALVGLATVSLAADKAADKNNAKNENETTATVTKVDAKKNTLTVTLKDKDGKEETNTLTLTNDVKIVDANDKAATLDTIKAGDEVTLTHRDGKLVEVERENAKGTAKKGHKHEATITKVDAKNGTVTVQMKDKNGKEVEKTFTLTGESRYLDSTGREAAVDVFQSGNEVLVLEEQGKLVQMQQKDKKHSEKKDNQK
jgi:uncharacterized protein YigE (DUF2233 family)